MIHTIQTVVAVGTVIGLVLLFIGVSFTFYSTIVMAYQENMWGLILVIAAIYILCLCMFAFKLFGLGA